MANSMEEQIRCTYLWTRKRRTRTLLGIPLSYSCVRMRPWRRDLVYGRAHPCNPVASTAQHSLATACVQQVQQRTALSGRTGGRRGVGIVRLVILTIVACLVILLLESSLLLNGAKVASVVVENAPYGHVGNQTSHATTTTTEPLSTFYSQLRSDRSGAAIQDMLFAHAHAFSSLALNNDNGMTYGGACPKSLAHAMSSNTALLKSILTRLGLSDILPIACPSRWWWMWRNKRDDRIRPRSYYVGPEHNQTDDWTPEWLHYIQSHIPFHKVATANAQRQHRPRHAVVHIRRGDVSPCSDAKASSPHQRRYLANAYYKAVIQQYVPREEYHVILYSEEASVEPWTELLQELERENVSLRLGGGESDIVDIWRDMMTADILILSKSSFSFVPATLNAHGTIVYTDFWHPPLAHWTRVNDQLQGQIDIMNAQVQRQYCDQPSSEQSGS